MIRTTSKKILLLTTIAVVGFTGCFQEKAEEKKQQTSSSKPSLPVKVFNVNKENNTTKKTYPTILKAYDQVDVMARVSGALEKKYFDEGDFVKKGTMLYKIEPDIYLANLNMKKANFTKAKKDYERAKALFKSKSISNQTFDDYTFQYESSKAALKEAQINFNYTDVKAPIDGIVGLKKHSVGDIVGSSASNSHLITITNTNPIHAEFSLPKDDIDSFLTQIKNKEVKVNLLANGKVYENGEIDFIAPTIDSNTDTLLLRAKFKNPNNELIVGNFTKVEIQGLSLGEVFIVPENAVLKTAKTSMVYVVDENNIAKVRPVKTGSLLEKGKVIKEGLKVNEKVVISNLAKLRPDTKVQIINKEK
ncbi:efflux transporter periplasmic adaptor subunit [Arcobacter sp. CECT 8983]|uniref:efflux RND transporter periplasmic adaptor subunit n=1 Tax=Arcobacter sp. CECT 8983 TaxID=2044508 RepID=UPI00100B53CD|nr:efflux RND transporter periplasmic adaptor subunit [Arcobacter sp. CECT 8983]RXJ91619.1 efflux transporter periplasmic adaptor subunit [Arcobacter sp. CECT 8983]